MGLTGDIFNGFTFDGEDSKDYGVYITGSGVFSSPERDVEMISIPGRDGAFALDRGRFSNIEVVYPAGLFGVDKADFASAISAFRNMLGSRVGYCRLEDDYNPGEYRMAVFKAGLEVSPASLESGEFDIVFECMPQRWLTSGESAVALSSGDDITNPTLFDSKPLLQVWGYGDIDLGGETITLNSVPVGWVQVKGAVNYPVYPDYSAANIGDTIQVNRSGMSTVSYNYPLASGIASLSSYTKSNVVFTPTGVPNASVLTPDWHNGYLYFKVYWGGPLSAVLGTASTLLQCEFDINLTGKNTSNTTVSSVYHVVVYLKVDTDGGIINSGSSIIKSSGTTMLDVSYHPVYKVGDVWVDSTKSANGTPTNIDLDIGEAWYLSGGDVISSDSALVLPATLPTLPPGATSITYDNTITQFKVVPRWWQL